MTYIRIPFLFFFVLCVFGCGRALTTTSELTTEGEAVPLSSVNERIAENAPFIVSEVKNSAPPLASEGQKETSIKVDWRTPLSELQVKAGQGNPDAMYWLGVLYDHGLNTCKIDREKSREWCQKAAQLADTGSAAAQFSQGLVVKEEYAIKLSNRLKEFDQLSDEEMQNFNQRNHDALITMNKESIQWFRPAAEQGFVPAQGALGDALIFDSLSTPDEDEVKSEAIYNEGKQWLAKAAVHGYVPGSIQYARSYLLMENKQTEAAQLERKAADMGDTLSQCVLGFSYLDGYDPWNIKKDEAEAVRWFLKAIAQGEVIVACILGECYQYGRGVAKDNAEALKWYDLAVKHGDQNAGRMRELLLKFDGADEAARKVGKQIKQVVLDHLNRIESLHKTILKGGIEGNQQASLFEKHADNCRQSVNEIKAIDVSSCPDELQSVFSNWKTAYEKLNTEIAELRMMTVRVLRREYVPTNNDEHYKSISSIRDATEQLTKQTNLLMDCCKEYGMELDWASSLINLLNTSR